MKRLSRLVAGLLMIGALAACAATTSMGPSGPGTTRQTGLGEVLTDANGMTLYTYDKDTPEKSNCTGFCAIFWPPVIAADTTKLTGGFTAITRDDGTKQWAFHGKPLYEYINDAKAGDTRGDGVDRVWHVAKP